MGWLRQPLKQFAGGLVGATFAAGEFGFGGDEAAFDGGFEDSGAVALQVGLDAPQGGNGGIQPGELLLDLRDDAPLLGQGCEWDYVRGDLLVVNPGPIAGVQMGRK